MATKTNDPALKMTRVITRVKLMPGEPAGLKGSIYDTSDLDDGPLDVMGTMVYFWEDGSAAPCYLVLNKAFVMSPRAIRMFSVLDWE
jgi:hypothetical protein